MARLRYPLISCIVLSAPVVHATGVSAEEWAQRHIFSRIDITGHRTIGYHLNSVTGDREAFDTLNYYGRGSSRFTNSGQMNIAGHNVLGFLNFNYQIVDDRYDDPQNQRFSIDFNTGPFTVNLGDIRGNLIGQNRFASLNRSLKGAAVSYRQGRLGIKGVTSQASGSATTVSFQGDNSTGPYYLRSSRLVQDSVKVRVDGQEMQLGQDFTVNYDLGSISFVNRVIPPTSSIVVSYEALSINSTQGSIQGFGATYDFGKFGKVGLTQLEQKTGGQRGLNTRTDLFQGFGDPSTPYFLRYEPLRDAGHPITVKLNGVTQFEGVHYAWDAVNPAVFYFLFPVPATSNIDVTYTPKPVSVVDGDRRVTGLDYSIPLGKEGTRGYLSYNQALGQLTNSVTPQGGLARGVDLQYKLKGWNLHGSWRNIPSSFVGVETLGFARNEDTVEFGADGAKGPFRYGFEASNSVIQSRTGSSSSNTFVGNRTTSSNAYFSYAPSAKTNWSLNQRQTTGETSLGQSRLDTTSLSHSRSDGRLNTRFSFDRTNGRGPVSTGTAFVNTDVALDTLRLDLDYSAGEAWALSGRTSVSNIRSGPQSGVGNDLAVGLSYRPATGPFNFEASYAQSKSGELAALSGFQNGLGLGYNGNGFSSGVSGDAYGYTGGRNYKVLNLSGTYKLTNRMTFGARGYMSDTSGGFTSNSVARGLGFDFDWDLGRSHYLALSLNQTNTKFNNGIKSDSTSFDTYLAGATGPWTYRLGTSFLISGGNSDYAQDSFGFDFSLLHKIDSRQRLTFALTNGRTAGYQPQLDSYMMLGYEYRLFRNVSLLGSYKWRHVKNLDLSTAGAYRAKGFDLELTFDFAG